MRGRKNAYETTIKPRLSEISEWLKNGATDKQIAYNLGITQKTLCKYKAEKSELSEFFKNERQSLVLQLRGALIKRAMGFNYTETKTVKEQVDLPDEIKKYLIENGFTQEQLDQARLVKTEIANKFALPDVAALNLALKNYDKENWANDPQMLALRERELAIKEKQSEEW